MKALPDPKCGQWGVGGWSPGPWPSVVTSQGSCFSQQGVAVGSVLPRPVWLTGQSLDVGALESPGGALQSLIRAGHRGPGLEPLRSSSQGWSCGNPGSSPAAFPPCQSRVQHGPGLGNAAAH